MKLIDITNIKKNKFWVAIGGAIVFMIAIYFFVVNPFRLKNVKKIETIENVITKLEGYKIKGSKIRNENWIKAEEAKLAMIKNAQLEYKEFYKERDRQLEKIFASVYGEEVQDEALWGNSYVQKVNVLMDKIKGSNVSLSENALPFKNWGSEIPTWDEIVPEQKKFWITEELLNIVLKDELRVRNIRGISFKDRKFSPGNAHSEQYDVIPFTIIVSMDVEGVLSFINEFSKSKLCFEIEAVNISGKLKKLRSSETPGNSYPFDKSIVDVVIDAYALDFKYENV